MNQLDHVSGLKKNHLKSSDPNRDYNFKKELFPILILITVGIIGALYSLTNRGNKKINQTQSKITISSTEVQNTGSIAPQKLVQNGVLMAKETTKNQLSIEGEKEAGQKLNFIIQHFDKKAKYELHLGDGVIIQAKANNIQYSYKNSGKFKVRLVAKYEGKSADLFSETIQIATPVEIAPEAHREQ